jgi:peptide/nickel transport system ATP-binding protein
VNISLLQCKNLKKYFPVRALFRTTAHVHAVDDVSLDVRQGETFGLVGESGSGKSTFGRMMVALLHPDAGEVYFDGKNVFTMERRDMKSFRRRISMVFQDPFSSLDPRMTIMDIVSEPMRTHGLTGSKEPETIIRHLEEVSLKAEHLYRYPHEFSGGQRQRIALARALSTHPELVVLDEPTSALDVSVQAQILNLLRSLQQSHGLTYVFISHNLNVVRNLSDRMAVMYLGKLVELGPSDAIFGDPLHPYSAALISAIPTGDPDVKKRKILVKGETPTAVNPFKGCRFHTRCPYVKGPCREKEPILADVGGDRFVACHFATR